MDKGELTNKHLLAVFFVVALFMVMAWRGDVPPKFWHVCADARTALCL